MMKDSFSMFYNPDFDKLWEECIFVLDANVLLNLYRYTIKTKESFLKVIFSLSNRVFIPHQVAMEYYSNRTKVIIEQADAYNNVVNILKNASENVEIQLNKDLKDYSKKHPIIDVSIIKESINETFKSVVKEIEEQEKTHPNYNEEDSIRIFLEENLKNIGKPFESELLSDIYKEGEKRYKQERPPGYKDAPKKKDERKYYRGIVIESQYGDLLVWKQLIEEAKKQGKSVILVTDDTKEDWWKKEHGKTIGPRPELIDEFMHLTNKNFYMYESHRFLEYAQNHLSQHVDNDAVEEIRELHQYINQKEIHDETNGILDEPDNEGVRIEVVGKNGKRYFRTKRYSATFGHRNYRTGDKVIHEKWGIGTVVDQNSFEIKVSFPSPVGVKRLDVRTASLRRYYESSQ